MTMDTKEQLDALKDIREMMSRSARFISLSGMSGIVIGMLAISFGIYLHFLVQYFNVINGTSYDYCSLIFNDGVIRVNLLVHYGLLALALLGLSVAVSIWFTARKAKKIGENIWDDSARRVVVNMFVPLVVGGLVCLTFLYHLQLYFIAPLMLIFYGFALFNTSKYTVGEIRSLGLINMVLGLLALLFVHYGLFIWTFGFGLMHIVYGVWMYKKYDASN